MSHKSQVLELFKLFQTMIRTQFQASIKELQTDWGGEYRSLTTLLSQQGIIHRISYPHTPSQNGMVERRNRTIQEKGLTLLAHSRLPPEFWEHAFHTSIYLRNWLPTPILSHKSPFQCLYNRSPDYLSLRAFGCLCFPFLGPYRQTN